MENSSEWLAGRLDDDLRQIHTVIRHQQKLHGLRNIRSPKRWSLGQSSASWIEATRFNEFSVNNAWTDFLLNIRQLCSNAMSLRLLTETRILLLFLLTSSCRITSVVALTLKFISIIFLKQFLDDQLTANFVPG